MIELFESQDQSVPISQRPLQRLPSFKQLTVHQEGSNFNEPTVRSVSKTSQPGERNDEDGSAYEDLSVSNNDEGGVMRRGANATSLIEDFVGRGSKARINKPLIATTTDTTGEELSKDKRKLVKQLEESNGPQAQPTDGDDPREPVESNPTARDRHTAVDDFNERIAEQQLTPLARTASSSEIEPKEDLPVTEESVDAPHSSIVQSAFDRMRPRRILPEVATITIGSKTMTSVLGSSPSMKLQRDRSPLTPVNPKSYTSNSSRADFSSSMRSFAAPGSIIKTVGRPQSKSPMSVNYTSDGDDAHLSEDEPCPASSISESDINVPDKCDELQNVHISQERTRHSSPFSDLDSDGDYVDEDEKKAIEEAKVAELIRLAEQASSVPSQDNKKRAHQILKGAGQKDSTTHLVQKIDASIERIDKQLSALSGLIHRSFETSQASVSETAATTVDVSPEERLSLTVSKADFAAMHVSGQFNLGFILATRNNTDLFIIDQHASDEKYNFERLQATTVVQNQRLVQPRSLQLTAVEEEIIFEYNEALLKNGFLLDMDTSGDAPTGQRCKLVSLPMSREVVFDVTDLEELIALLAESSASSSMKNVPRPSKVRRMFAMRACRSSVMVGRTLTLKQMESLVRKMGEIDKPWNCPHGRPTMRHVCGLEGWDGWSEGDGIVGLEEEPEHVDWGRWVSNMRSRQEGIENGKDQGEEYNSKDEEEDGEPYGEHSVGSGSDE